MSMNGFFVAIPEQHFFEFCEAEDPLDLDYVSPWDVADSWDVLRKVTDMDEYLTGALQEEVYGLNAADGKCHFFTPDRVEAFYEQLLQIDLTDDLGNLKPKSGLRSLYRGEGIEPEQLADHILTLRNRLQTILPIYHPETNRHNNGHVVFFYVA
jgi:hypothetical protein